MAELNADIRETVRERYAKAAQAAAAGRFDQAAALESEAGCCGSGASCTPADETGVFGSSLYDEDSREAVPDAAVNASLGCGVPTAVADLRDGDVVLDLGSGAGADVLISARRVAPAGRAIGLDMTDEMLELARANAAEAGVENAEFVKGYLENMPLADESVDVVISNCVINLSADKPKTLREAARPSPRRTIRDLRRHRQPRHGRRHQGRHGRLDRLHRRRAHRSRIPPRTHSRRSRPDRNHPNSPSSRPRLLSDHPRPQTLLLLLPPNASTLLRTLRQERVLRQRTARCWHLRLPARRDSRVIVPQPCPPAPTATSPPSRGCSSVAAGPGLCLPLPLRDLTRPKRQFRRVPRCRISWLVLRGSGSTPRFG